MAARGLVNGRGPLRRSGRDSVLKYAGLLSLLLSLQPGEEVVDARAAYGHLEVRFRVRDDAQAAAGLLDDAGD